jgi:undecaprenyl-phosphate 4-deoxy-4-formamido-L-arabinose transferase
MFFVFLVIRRLMIGPEAEGLFTLFALMFFLIGIALFGIGLLGEYVGRIYQQVRHRPRYLVEAVLEQTDEKPKRVRKPKTATEPATDMFADGEE